MLTRLNLLADLLIVAFLALKHLPGLLDGVRGEATFFFAALLVWLRVIFFST